MNDEFTLADGVLWCSTHSGLRNEDTDRNCDMYDVDADFGDSCEFHDLYFAPEIADVWTPDADLLPEDQT